MSTKEPMVDPVDSHTDVFTAKAALSELTVLSQKDFAILREILTVFTIHACSRKTYLNKLLEKMFNHKRDGGLLVYLKALKKQGVHLKGC